MHPLAAAPMEKVQEIPVEFWWKAGLIIVGFVALVVILRKLAGMNKILLGIIIVVVMALVGFSWIHERNEPAFMTPVIERIAPFFPGKSSYSEKQKTSPKI